MNHIWVNYGLSMDYSRIVKQDVQKKDRKSNRKTEKLKGCQQWYLNHWK